MTSKASQRNSMLLPFHSGLMITTPFDQECARLADRHYSRRTVGSDQFAYSGRKLVLRDYRGDVLFVWMYADVELRMDHQVGYNCSIFRNESSRRSSEIILEAERFAFEKWGPNRLYTYIDPQKIRSTNPGYCFLMAGWRKAGRTRDGRKILLEK